jgi:hypothetical protein
VITNKMTAQCGSNQIATQTQINAALRDLGNHLDQFEKGLEHLLQKTEMVRCPKCEPPNVKESPCPEPQLAPMAQGIKEVNLRFASANEKLARIISELEC